MHADQIKQLRLDESLSIIELGNWTFADVKSTLPKKPWVRMDYWDKLGPIYWMETAYR